MEFRQLMPKIPHRNRSVHRQAQVAITAATWHLAIRLLARRADTNRPANAVARLVNREGGKVPVLVLRGEPQVAHVVAGVDHRVRLRWRDALGMRDIGSESQNQS